MYNIIPKFFCFCNNNLLCFMLFLFFLYFQSILKKLSTRYTSQFVGLWPGWGCRSELWQSNSEKYTAKQGMRIAKMIFWYIPKRVWKGLSARCTPQFVGDLARMEGAVACYNTQLQVKYTAKWGVQIAKCFKIYLSALFVLFCYFFNYAVGSILSLYNLFVFIRIV